MRSEEIKAIVRREIEQIWNNGNLAAADEIIAEHYVLHEASEDIKGLEAFKVFAADFRAAFHDVRFDIDDVIVEGDKVVVRYTFMGKHDGEETWNYLDKLSVLVQLGWWVPPKDWQLAFTWGESVERRIDAPSDPYKYKICARRGLEELWNTGDLAMADEVYAIDFVNHEITHRQYCDLESYKKYVSVIHHVMRDFKVAVEALIADGDKVTIHWRVSGAEKKTGNACAWYGITVFYLSDHKIIEAWWSRDALGIAQQMGIAPMSGE